MPAVLENLAKNLHSHELKPGIISIGKQRDFHNPVIFPITENLSKLRPDLLKGCRPAARAGTRFVPVNAHVRSKMV